MTYLCSQRVIQTYFLVPEGHPVLLLGPEVHHDLPLFPEGHPVLLFGTRGSSRPNFGTTYSIIQT
jgi:hypothetical protein